MIGETQLKYFFYLVDKTFANLSFETKCQDTHEKLFLLDSTDERKRLEQAGAVRARNVFHSVRVLHLTSFVRNATDANEIELVKTGGVYLHGYKFRKHV